jgi:hypothetical protein
LTFQNWQSAQAGNCWIASDQYSIPFVKFKPSYSQRKTLFYDLIEESLPSNIPAWQMKELVEWAFNQWRKVAANVPQVMERTGAYPKIKFGNLHLANIKDWAAITNIEIDYLNNRLIWRNITFNNKLKFAIKSDPNAIHLPSLLLHEVGHVLGLPHLEHNFQVQVMTASLHLGEIRVEFGECDIAAIQTRYSK